MRQPKVPLENCGFKEENVMSATSVGTIVKESVGWSIGLSVLMILANTVFGNGGSPWLTMAVSRVLRRC